MSYAMYKKSINPKSQGFVDLTLTKAFTNKLYPKKVSNSSFLFDSRDSKATHLFGKYGQDLKGINKDTFNRLQKQVYAPALVMEIKRITGL
jgi:hypothetical protein